LFETGKQKAIAVGVGAIAGLTLLGGAAFAQTPSGTSTPTAQATSTATQTPDGGSAMPHGTETPDGRHMQKDGTGCPEKESGDSSGSSSSTSRMRGGFGGA